MAWNWLDLKVGKPKIVLSWEFVIQVNKFSFWSRHACGATLFCSVHFGERRNFRHVTVCHLWINESVFGDCGGSAMCPNPWTGVMGDKGIGCVLDLWPRGDGYWLLCHKPCVRVCISATQLILISVTLVPFADEWQDAGWAKTQGRGMSTCMWIGPIVWHSGRTLPPFSRFSSQSRLICQTSYSAHQ